MIPTIVYIILAAIGIGFLIFIHELGHYLMAKRVGMRVEVFSIGFGKAIYQWRRGEEVWKIGWLPFGGFVRIAGMEMSEEVGVEEPDTFFAKSPWDRIKVAFMGPLVNLLFAFLAFTLIWSFGGREKYFSEYTTKIGWVDPNSEVFMKGLRPGDEVLSYNSRDFSSMKDHITAPIMSGNEITIQGNQIDYTTSEKHPYTYHVKTYPHPLSIDEERKTSGIILPANYVIYRSTSEHLYEDPTSPGSPLYNSGIEIGDRVVWIDGQRIFSLYQLSQILNDDHLLVTIQRGNETFFRRVPRIKIEDLKLDNGLKDELVDWQHESGNSRKKLRNLYALGYDLNPYGVVEGKNRFIDQEVELDAFPEHSFSQIGEPLRIGDKIIAVGGDPVEYSHEIFGKVQNPKVNVIVQRDPALLQSLSFKEANEIFENDINAKDLDKLVGSVGSPAGEKQVGSLILLNSVVPKRRDAFTLSPEKQALIAAEMQEQKEMIESIEDPDRRAQAKELFEKRGQQLILGFAQEDRKVIYNPNPFEQFVLVYEEIWATLVSLVSGILHPKFLAGPIGMVQIAQQSWGVSFSEALFWLGAISLNLGFLNLLPIPVLDGGYIVIFFVEMITKKRMQKRTLEKLIIPFVVLLVGLFFYATYNDISRIFGGFFK